MDSKKSCPKLEDIEEEDEEVETSITKNIFNFGTETTNEQESTKNDNNNTTEASFIKKFSIKLK